MKISSFVTISLALVAQCFILNMNAQAQQGGQAVEFVTTLKQTGWATRPFGKATKKAVKLTCASAMVDAFDKAKARCEAENGIIRPKTLKCTVNSSGTGLLVGNYCVQDCTVDCSVWEWLDFGDLLRGTEGSISFTQ